MASGIRASRREDVLRLLDEAGEPQTIAALADRLGAHPNTVRFHLERLLADGQVERTVDDRGLPGRPAQAVPTGAEDGWCGRPPVSDAGRDPGRRARPHPRTRRLGDRRRTTLGPA
ncbi:helix-turn-helix domain-containing protein [Microbacterium elymi]|uniref:Helix-turn-helix domain-containing protein n=1 Tax=Microbacterium elymi TaxID=2909587 RepID=A0ABY5NJ25_9MICO|nr:helix-turn-helix domain-containing protein [Microbacterium elymi]UUT35163.1 helix-turn-helix domain-containing protein [Microbacterium elymi]